MGTTKAIPEFNPEVDETQRYSMVPITERSFISNPEIRRNLKKLCIVGLAEPLFNKVIKSTPKEFADYIVYTTSISKGKVVVVSQNYQNARSVIECICHSEPLTGLFQFSLLNSNERKATVLLSQGESISAHELLPSIFRKMNSLDMLINSIAPVLTGDHFKLHPVVDALLQAILSQIDRLYKRKSRKIIEYSPLQNEFFNYFPSLSKQYKLPLYEFETEENPERCSKSYPKHNKFSPGVLIIACKHRIGYGFQILRQRESTVVIFNLLLSLFRDQPSAIIYDNACNLHKNLYDEVSKAVQEHRVPSR